MVKYSERNVMKYRSISEKKNVHIMKKFNENTSKQSSLNISIRYSIMLVFKFKCEHLIFVHYSLYFAACLRRNTKKERKSSTLWYSR